MNGHQRKPSEIKYSLKQNIDSPHYLVMQKRKLFTSFLVTLKHFFENGLGGSKLPRCTESKISYKTVTSFLCIPPLTPSPRQGHKKAKAWNDDLQPVVAAETNTKNSF